LDTDIFSLLFQSDPTVIRNAIAHAFDFLSVSVITVEEVWNGWASAVSRAKTPAQVALGYFRLTETLNELRNWTVVSLTVGAIARYNVLKQQKLNVGGNDLGIAAIALETGATVVTRNRRDFARIPGVAIEVGVTQSACLGSKYEVA
jgi:tRNA(fMet)-specific endonuclease VapC